MRRLLLACLLAALPAASHANDVRGVYVGAGLGLDLHSQGRPAATVTGGNLAVQSAGRRFDTGGRVNLNVGYGFGNGLRIEAEGFLAGAKSATNRSATVGAGGKAGTVGMAGLMGNVLYDFDFKRLGWGEAPLGLTPYVGAGVGLANVGYGNLPGIGQPGRPLDYTTTRTAFAAQFINGVAIPLNFAPGLAATLEYRATAIAGGRAVSKTVGSGDSRATIRSNAPAMIDQSVMLGLRYAFGG